MKLRKILRTQKLALNCKKLYLLYLIWVGQGLFALINQGFREKEITNRTTVKGFK